MIYKGRLRALDFRRDDAGKLMQRNAGVRLLYYVRTIVQMSTQVANAGKRVPENR